VAALDRYHARRKELERAAVEAVGPVAMECSTGDDDGGGGGGAVPSIPGVSDGGGADGAALVVDHPPVVPAARVSPESVLVDALWLIGSRLEPDNAVASKGGKDDADDNAKGYGALCKIIEGLVYGPPTPSSTNTNTNTNTNGGGGTSDVEWRSTLVKLMQTSLESTLLGSSGVVAQVNPMAYVKKLKRMLTNMYYRLFWLPCLPWIYTVTMPILPILLLRYRRPQQRYTHHK